METEKDLLLRKLIDDTEYYIDNGTYSANEYVMDLTSVALSYASGTIRMILNEIKKMKKNINI